MRRNSPLKWSDISQKEEIFRRVIPLLTRTYGTEPLSSQKSRGSVNSMVAESKLKLR
jgi:hypothetical protein